MNESPIEKLRRINSWLKLENEWILQDLPSITAIEEYCDLWKVYDTDFLEGIIQCIEQGESPKPYNDFVNKYKLEWMKF